VRHYTSVACAVVVCPSSHLSVGVLLKWLNTVTRIQNRTLAQGLGIQNPDDYFQTRVLGLDALEPGFHVRFLQL